MALRKRYCAIVSCENALGTLSREVQFYRCVYLINNKKFANFYFYFTRMPLKGQMRENWIQSIERHQKLHEGFTYIHVCSLHFKSEDILPTKDLKKGAVPSIFRWLKNPKIDWSDKFVEILTSQRIFIVFCIENCDSNKVLMAKKVKAPAQIQILQIQLKSI